ncbi:MAG: ATP/GTP-binding protein [Nitrospinota bacterium]
MVNFNYAARELTAKIVYYGPGLCGKTTNLELLHKKVSPNQRGKMVSLATDTDRTLFFDLLPVDLGTIGGFKTKIQLFTVPGQTYYNATRKLVLKGADGVVFVADSQTAQLDANLESYKNLGENLKVNGLEIDSIPLVMQWNKQDLQNLMPIEELEAKINVRKVPAIKAVAVKGDGVLETFKAISKEVMHSLQEKVGGGVKPAATEKKRDRSDTAQVKVTTERADAYAPAVAKEAIAAEMSLEAHGVESGKRTVEELGKVTAEAIASGSPEADELLNDLRKNIHSIIEENKKINFRYETLYRQLNKLAKLMSGAKK